MMEIPWVISQSGQQWHTNLLVGLRLQGRGKGSTINRPRASHHQRTAGTDLNAPMRAMGFTPPAPGKDLNTPVRATGFMPPIAWHRPQHTSVGQHGCLCFCIDAYL